MKLLYTLKSQVYLQTYYYYNNYGSPILNTMNYLNFPMIFIKSIPTVRAA